MDDRLSSLLLFLRQRFASDSRPEEVEAYLSSEGYDRGQIGEIIALLFADLPGTSPRRDRMASSSASTFRVLGPHERGRFAPDAWGHLLSLSSAGVLSASEFEHVIERALLQIEGRIALDDLRSLMELSGFGDAAAGTEQLPVH
jgi:Smg protein